MGKFDMVVSSMMNEVFAVEPNFANALIDNLAAYKKGQSSHTEIANDSVTYQVVGDNAIIAIDGAMYKKNIGGMCASVVSYDQIIAKIDEAELNNSVNKIIFRVDTRGGSVAGADEVRDRIKNSEKETIVYFENIGASGGMWIFSACDKVYANETTMLGSIGVVILYKESKEQILSIVSSNAPNKACDISDDKCKTRIQSQIDKYESMFLDRMVESFNGKSKEQIINDFDKGAVIFAQEAYNLGYLDGVISFRELLDNTLATMPSSEKIAENQHNVEIQNKGLDVEDELQAQLDTANATIEAKQTEIDGVKEQMKSMVSMDFVKEIMAMGSEYSVSAETMVAMLESNDSMKAENIALKASLSVATVQAGHQEGDNSVKEEPVMSEKDIQGVLNGN